MNFDFTAVRDAISIRFAKLVESSQMIVTENLFIDAFDMSEDTLDLIRGTIIQQGLLYPEFGETIPKNWYQLQGLIEEMREKGIRIIPYNTLKEANATLENPLSLKELELFVVFQHNSGNLLHFKDPHLIHLVVMDPTLIIDATKSIITCQAFALDVWGKREWDNIVGSGKVEKSYIRKVWRKRSKKVLHKHREYLMNVMEKLDIVVHPKVYDDGFVVEVSFVLIPCMLQAQAMEIATGQCEGDIQFRLSFNDVMLPAVYNRLVASCLALWSVEGQLYDGYAALRSGPQHILIIARESNSIALSIRNKDDPTKVDVYLARSLQLYVSQTIQRIMAIYGTAQGGDNQDLYQIEYNNTAISLGFGQDEGNVGIF